jgi:hypothetical protein
MNWGNTLSTMLGLAPPQNSKPCNESFLHLQQGDALYSQLEELAQKEATQ